MMEFLYRSKPPAYRGSCPPPQQASNGFLSGIWCNLFGGGGAPAYRTKGGTTGAAGPTGSRCFWQIAPTSPPYKAAPATVPDVGSGDPDPDCECPEGVVAHEVYIE